MKKKNAISILNEEVSLMLGSLKGLATRFFKDVDIELDMVDIPCTQAFLNVYEASCELRDTGILKAGVGSNLIKDLELLYAIDVSCENAMEILGSFVVDYLTETVHKGSFTMVKALLDDFVLEGDELFIDTGKACTILANKVQAVRNEDGSLSKIRRVSTSENGFLREISDVLGRGTDLEDLEVIMVKVDGDSDELDAKRQVLFRRGFTDRRTSVHYMFGLKGPSMDRKANCLFIPGNTWDDTFKTWFRITGTKNAEGFEKAFGNKLFFNKMLARVSSRGSSSFNLETICPELKDYFRGLKVLYVADPEYFVEKPYHELVAPNTLEAKSGKRKITMQDGAGLLDVTVAAHIASALRLISMSEMRLFLAFWNNAIQNGRSIADVPGYLMDTLHKVPSLFQFRHGSKKGTLVVTDLRTLLATKTYGDCCYKDGDGNPVVPMGHTADEVVDLKEWDIIIPESVRKYVDDEWSAYPLEICNCVKKKGSMVYMNSLFLASLDPSNGDKGPNKFIPLVKDIIEQAEESLESPEKALAFHKIFGEVESESGFQTSPVVDVLRTDATLINEVQVQKWRYDQYQKLFNDLALGRIPVPGTYTYMVSDPNRFLNVTFGTHLPELAEGEFWFNEKECECGLFRTPLIHPFEAQKVQLVQHPAYSYLKDVVVFNCYDGVADKMGGADFDGDTCAVVPADTWQGATIVDAIRDIPYDVWEEAPKGTKRYFRADASDKEAMENLISHLLASSKVDRTGIITNYANAALDISNDLLSAIWFAKKLDCTSIEFIHPSKLDNFGAFFAPKAVNGVLQHRGFVYGAWDKESKKYVWTEDEYSVLGTKSFDEVAEFAYKYLELVEMLRVLQGREIDGAKTGVFAEGPRFNPATGEGNDFTEQVKVRIVPASLLARQIAKGRISDDPEDKTYKRKLMNSYTSLSPWGRVYSYVHKEVIDNPTGILARLKDNGIIKTNVLWGLLTEDEKAMFNLRWYTNGQTEPVGIIDIAKMCKSAYATKVKSYMDMSNGFNASSAEEASDVIGSCTIGDIKEECYRNLVANATAMNVPLHVMSAACYIATYSKDGNIQSSTSFAWIMLSELLEVFARHNRKYALVSMPRKAYEAEVRGGILFVNDAPFRKIDAQDGVLSIETINGRRYAYVHMNAETSVIMPGVNKEVVYSGKEYVFNLYGFKYYNYTPETFLSFVNGKDVEVVLHTNGRQELCVNGTACCSIAPSANAIELAELSGRTVRIIDNGTIKGQSLVGIKVTVIA